MPVVAQSGIHIYNVEKSMIQNSISRSYNASPTATYFYTLEYPKGRGGRETCGVFMNFKNVYIPASSSSSDLYIVLHTHPGK